METPVLNAFNELFNLSEFPSKIPIGIYGPPLSGKTVLTLQLSSELMVNKGKNVLWLDTEGGANFFITSWFNTFKTRLGAPDNLAIMCKDARGISNLLALHGIKHRLNISKEGKIENVVTGFDESVVEKWVKELNVGVLVYDSLTNPLRTAYAGGRVNFPARADAVNLLFLQLQGICNDYDVTVLTTHHQSADPAKPWERPTVTLGSALLYNVKVVLYLERIHHKKYPDLRRLTLVRWFNARPWERSLYLNLTDAGFERVAKVE